MATAGELTDRLEKLKKARASGVRRIQQGDRASEFKSDAEMAAAIADLERQIAAASGNPIKNLYVRSRGL